MKIKSFAMLVAAGLLATSFIYVAPAMADDISNNGQAMQTLADNSANGSDQSDMNTNNNTLTPDNSSMPSDNGSSTMPSDNGSATMPSDNTMQPAFNPPSNPNAAPGNSNDEGGPDTATGDDDY